MARFAPRPDLNKKKKTDASSTQAQSDRPALRPRRAFSAGQGMAVSAACCFCFRLVPRLRNVFQALGVVDLNKGGGGKVSRAAATKLLQVVSDLRRALPADQVEVRMHPESKETVTARLKEWQSGVADFESTMDAAMENVRSPRSGVEPLACPAASLEEELQPLEDASPRITKQ